MLDEIDVKKIIIRKAYPIFSELGVIRNLVISPESTLFQLQITASETGDIGFKRLSFDVASRGLSTGVNGLGGEWKLYRTDMSDTEPISTSTLVNGKVVFDFEETDAYIYNKERYGK